MGVKKQLDGRIRTLIENGVQSNQRTFFVIVGDNGKDQVVNLYYILTKSLETRSLPILWCYKSELGFSTNRQKRMRHIKKSMSKGIFDPKTEDPFVLFVASSSIRWTYYKDTYKILGNTYGMCVLQDFEAITPNILAHTIETVQGGGLVILLLRTMTSLRQLYTMTMDVHSRFTTESHREVKARFNERFLLSLSSCSSCLVMDDEMNILNISRSAKNITQISRTIKDGSDSEELKGLKKEMSETEIVGDLLSNTKTMDQAKALLTFIEAISEKTLVSTIILTAARGRGKSAALGLAISAAVAFGYSNIFVTSPSPENLNTLFEFVFKGFDALEWKEHLHYELIQSTNPSWNKCIVRINIFKNHRQTIQYVLPTDAAKLGQAELLVIDEAAAIPLTYVKTLLGPYLIFMASTINGYEGTGRSLSLKLIKQLKEQSNTFNTTFDSLGGRIVRELTLQEPIRYSINDPVEAWLNRLLCLDVKSVKNISSGCPHPDECNLYYVNRDTLFSYHRASELFLQRIVAIYVSSHYKNSPNDLQLMADAPAHHLFVLLPPVPPDSVSLPEVLCVIQVCLEGNISSQTIRNLTSRGHRAAGDLIPWTISQQFQDEDFPGLSGARIVRISTHPDYQNMKYGTKALELLKQYYQGSTTFIDTIDTPAFNNDNQNITNAETSNLIEENLKPRENLPSLLLSLNERPPEPLHYLGVSFGLTNELYRFWKRANFVPIYLRLTQNALTGEHTMIMIYQFPQIHSSLISCSPTWLYEFNMDFRNRFLTLLRFQFKELYVGLCLNILRTRACLGLQSTNTIDAKGLELLFSPHDLKRLEAYSFNLLDYHVVVDLIPRLAKLFFADRIPNHIKLSTEQCLFLLGLGLQCKTVDLMAQELDLQSSQILSYLNKVVRKFSRFFRELSKKEIMKDVIVQTTPNDLDLTPISTPLDEELKKAGEEAKKDLKEKTQKLFNKSMSQYMIDEKKQDWNNIPMEELKTGLVSIKSAK